MRAVAMKVLIYNGPYCIHRTFFSILPHTTADYLSVILSALSALGHQTTLLMKQCFKLSLSSAQTDLKLYTPAYTQKCSQKLL